LLGVILLLRVLFMGCPNVIVLLMQRLGCRLGGRSKDGLILRECSS
jgi:hypothetical protein